ncbi:hypothetical protein B0H13DRAFT_2261986 [Mycena leptocephala]|nr:hypothetical protein B0H13DRAFT_2261986 [Mycena leptocephala]
MMGSRGHRRLVAALFFIHWLFVCHARRRAAFSGPGRSTRARPSLRPAPAALYSHGGQPQTQTQTYASGMPAQASERDAVELGQYPPLSSAAFPNPNPTPSASASAPGPASASIPVRHPPPAPTPTPRLVHALRHTPEPGTGSSPAARQAYLAAELRAAQALLERGGKDVNTREVWARVRTLEERQGECVSFGVGVALGHGDSLGNIYLPSPELERRLGIGRGESSPEDSLKSEIEAGEEYRTWATSDVDAVTY